MYCLQKIVSVNQPTYTPNGYPEPLKTNVKSEQNIHCMRIFHAVQMPQDIHQGC